MPRRRSILAWASVALVVALLLVPRVAAAGLTHYWIWLKEPSPADVGRALADLRRLAAARPKLVKLTEAAGKRGPQIVIAGIGAAGYEDFVFPGLTRMAEVAQVARETQPTSAAELGAFNFCKTQWKDYDEVITASLYLARHYFDKETLVISSDSLETWEKGAALYEQVFQRKPPPSPWGPTQRELQQRKEADEARLSKLRSLKICGAKRDPRSTKKLMCTVAELGSPSLRSFTELEELTVTGVNVQLDLALLQPLARLRRLYLTAFVKVASLVPLERLTGLETLELSYSRLGDLSPLKTLRHLRRLKLVAAKLTDVTALAALDSLEELELAENALTDIQPLASLTRLRLLNLGFNRGIVDLRPVANLVELRRLELFATGVLQLAPLAALRHLEELDLVHTRPLSLEPLRGLPIKKLDLRETYTGDDRAVGSLTSLVELRTSRLSNPALLAPLSRLRRLDLAGGCIADLRPLAGLTALERLYLDSGRMTDLSPLAGLSRLRNLSITNSPVNSLAPLRDLRALEVLRIYGTQVTDLSPILALPKLESLILLSLVKRIPREQLEVLKQRLPALEIKTVAD